MQPVTSVAAAAVASNTSSIAIDYLLSPSSSMSVVQPDGFMITTGYYPAWRTHEAFRPHPLLREGPRLSEPPPQVSEPLSSRNVSQEEQEWAVVVGRLIEGGLAEEVEGTARLKAPVRLKGRTSYSGPIDNLDDLKWYLSIHGRNPGVRGVEPMSDEALSIRSRSEWPRRSTVPPPEPEVLPPPAVVPAEAQSTLPVAPKARPVPRDPVPAYLQEWFERRGRQPASLFNAFEEAVALPSEEIEDFKKHLSRMTKACDTALAAFGQGLDVKGTSDERHPIQKLLAQITVARAHALADAIVEGMQKGHKAGRELNQYLSDFL